MEELVWNDELQDFEYQPLVQFWNKEPDGKMPPGFEPNRVTEWILWDDFLDDGTIVNPALMP